MAWKANEQVTLRAGLNLADNPIPESLVNPLFPATVKNHMTLGLGYKASDTGEFNAAVTLAPASTVTNASGIAISHEQTNLQPSNQEAKPLLPALCWCRQHVPL